MRMRRKTWARPELAQCSYYVGDPKALRGKWQDWFLARQPIHLELGCGKGVFLQQIALKNPQINYMGIDLSDDVLGVARRNIEDAFGAELRQVNNVALISYNIEKILELMDENDRVERIYINFCNPWPRGKHHKKRLTHLRQLELYKHFLADGGEIHFKTDDQGLYQSTLYYFRESGLELLRSTEDLYQSGWPGNCTTEHEERFVSEGIRIKAAVAKCSFAR